METSGYQPASPEPSEEHAGFSPAPPPVTEQPTDDSTAVTATDGWNFSFVADQPASPFSAGPPVATAGTTPARAPEQQTATPVYDLDSEPSSSYSLETEPPARTAWRASHQLAQPGQRAHQLAQTGERSVPARTGWRRNRPALQPGDRAAQGLQPRAGSGRPAPSYQPAPSLPEQPEPVREKPALAALAPFPTEAVPTAKPLTDRQDRRVGGLRGGLPAHVDRDRGRRRHQPQRPAGHGAGQRRVGPAPHLRRPPALADQRRARSRWRTSRS